MYEELVKRLRDYEESGLFTISPYEAGEVADAIEELICEVADEHNTRLDAEERQRWIPVTERLPRYGDWVLGIGPKHGYHVCEYRGITHFPYSGDIPWFSAKGRTLTITHWMPLPKPPKEEV